MRKVQNYVKNPEENEKISLNWVGGVIF